MQNTPKNKKSFKRRLSRFLLVLLLLFVFVNLTIFITGKTYLYKGIQETYLKGKSGPGIYDSIVFPVRVANHANPTEKWKVKSPLLNINESSKEQLIALKTTSFLIVKNGEIIHESYYDQHNEHTKSNSFSMGKSFIGLLIGIAIDNHEISSFDAPITDYLPFRIPNDEGITIRHLLGMSSGLNWSESGSNPLSDNAEAYYSSDLNEIMKKSRFNKKPGLAFEYLSGNSQLLGIILKEATGVSPTEYFEQHVWSKIGAEHDLFWSLDREDGFEKTFCCAYATTRDYARIGQLILNNGKWNGEEVISSETLNTLLSPFDLKEAHYGLHFWRYNHPVHPAVYARGILGQYIVVIPSLNVVIVRTGHQRKEKYFIPRKKKKDVNFVLENGYKEHHPLDLFDYFSALEYVLEKDN
ncbi:serine hydrolase domain-containing protein [Brumimicrobium sp.]|uniref:serine hydrolase domain-containing protein n=1 Tax=Brumimicrobium sp. TaxID=2029867 RepID=UPI003A903666